MVDMTSAARELLAEARAVRRRVAGGDGPAPRHTQILLSRGAATPRPRCRTHSAWRCVLAEDLRASEVFSMMTAPLGAPVELHDAMSVRFTNGAVGAVSGSSCHLGYHGNKHVLSVRIIGSDGMLSVDLGRELVYWYGGPDQDIYLKLDDHAGGLRLRRTGAHADRPRPGKGRTQPVAGTRRGEIGGDHRSRLPERPPRDAWRRCADARPTRPRDGAAQPASEMTSSPLAPISTTSVSVNTAATACLPGVSDKQGSSITMPGHDDDHLETALGEAGGGSAVSRCEARRGRPRSRAEAGGRPTPARTGAARLRRSPPPPCDDRWHRP